MPTPPHLGAALAALSAAEPGYTLNEQFYLGTVKEVIASARLRRLLGNTGDAFRINYAKTPVDVLSERTLIQGITCSDATALALLNRIYAANQLGLEAKDVHLKAYEFGDAYLIGQPDDEVDGGVSLYAHDPRGVRVFYDPARPRKKSHAVQVWIEPGSEDNELNTGLWYRTNLYYPDRTEAWVSRNRIDDDEGRVDITVDDMELVPYASQETGDGEVDNDTGMVPVFHFRTGRPYGRSELEDAKGPQQGINKLMATMMGAVDYAGYPQRWVATDDALDPQPAADAFSPAPVIEYETQTDQPGLRPESSLEAGPGATWMLSGSKVSVGQFPAADTKNFLDPIHSLIKQMASVTDMPSHYYERGGQMPSGESFRQSESPLNKKLSDKLGLFGVTWHEVWDYCLAVNGMGPSDAQTAWAPPEVWTDKDSWESAKLQLEAGVPAEVVYLERGYAPDLVAQWVSAGAGLADVTVREE